MIVRILSIALLCLVVAGCKKKPEAEPPQHSTAQPVVSAPVQPQTPRDVPVSTNSPAPIEPLSAEQKPAPAPVVPSQPKIVAPGQDTYERALAVVRTNTSAGAAEEAVILFRAAAEKGNPAAQHALGVALLSGLGVQKNAEEGLKWLEKSAEQKNPDALFKLASLYARGIDLPRDDVKAAELARAAAEMGHTEAQYNLASLYASGRGMPKDIKEAAKWFQKAAEAGHPTAQANLGVLYAAGEGLEKNPAEAVKWWRKAAEQGQPSAQFNLAHALREGKIVPQDLVEAYKWYYLAAQQGDPDAATARDAMAVDMSPADVAAAMKQAREFKAKAFAKWQEGRITE